MNEISPATTPEALYEANVARLLAALPARRDQWSVWLDSLSQHERHLITWKIFQGQVGNGGFGQWVENGYHDALLPTLLLVLSRMQGEVSETLRKQMVEALTRLATILLEDDTDPEGRYLSDETHEALESLDDSYFRISEMWQREVIYYFAHWE